MKALRSLGLALFLPLLFGTGCAAISARQDLSLHQQLGLFPGVKDDVYYLVHPTEADNPSIQWLNVIDIPFSTVADAVMAPVDATGDPYFWIPSLDPNFNFAAKF